MARLPSLEKIRDNVRASIMRENLAKQSNGDEKPLFNALAIVPEFDMWNRVQWLHEVILPQIEKNKGADSIEYRNFTAVRDAVIWAMYIMSAYEKQALQIGNDKMLLEIWRSKAQEYEQQLLQYKTAEQIISGETIKDYREAVLQRALSMLEKQPSIIQ